MPIGIASPTPSGIPGFNSKIRLTAGVGGGPQNATLLPSWYNDVNYVWNANDSVMLPPAVPGGTPVYVFNRTGPGAPANTLQVFGNVSPQGVQDLIADATGNLSTAGVPVAANAVVVFYPLQPQRGFTNMPLPGTWQRRTLAA